MKIHVKRKDRTGPEAEFDVYTDAAYVSIGRVWVRVSTARTGAPFDAALFQSITRRAVEKVRQP